MKLSPKQIFLYVGSLVASVLVVFFGFKVLKPFMTNDLKTTSTESEKTQSEYITRVEKTIPKTLPKSLTYYQSIAQRCFDILLANFQFKKTEKDFEELKQLLRVLQPSELKQVFVSFGQRQQRNFLVSFGRGYTLTESIEKSFGSDSNYTKQLKVIFTHTKLW